MSTERPDADPVREPAARKQHTNANAPMPAHQDRLNELREEYAQTGGVLSGGAVWLFGEIARLREQIASRPAPVVQYGFRLRDSTLLDFATKADRDARMADFVAAEWDVTPLIRPVRPAQYGEWTEETR
jgi:hypothetical protein